MGKDPKGKYLYGLIITGIQNRDLAAAAVGHMPSSFA